MAETIISQLDRAFDKPIETNRQVNFISDRDAISALRRWQGMQVFVISEQKTYTLKTGILNTDWVESEAASLTGYTEQGGYTGTAQDIVDSIEMVTSGVEIISITHIANLDYYVVADPYKINSEYYSAAPTTVTLTVGDATNARIDVIYADVDGLIGVLAGTPSATPVKPIVSNTQRELTFRTVPALATVDPVVTNELVYNENVGVAGGEWDVTGWNLTALNFDSTAVAFNGTKSIYFNGVDPYFNVDFKNDTNIAVSGLSSFYFRVYVTEVLDRNISFFFQCLDTSFIATGTYRSVKNGLFGFDRNVLNTWQLISIPIAFFNLPVAEIKGIRFMVSSIKKPKMYIDTMAFQYNVTQPDLTPTIYELTSNKKTDVETNKTSNTFYPSIKSIVDWIVARFSPISGSANYIQNQNASAQTASQWITGIIKTNSSLEGTTAKLTNLTDGYLPYHISDASGLGNSNIYNDGTKTGFGTATPDTGIHVKGTYPIGFLTVERTNVNGGGQAGVAAYVTDGKSIGDGNAFSLIMKNASNANISYGQIIAEIIDPSTGAEASRLNFNTYKNGINTTQFIVFDTGAGKFASSVQVGDNTAAASATNVGAQRYRVSGNNSYVDVCMQVSSTTYQWINIVTNTW